MDAAATANLPLLVAGFAFVLAFVFGAVANRVNFCTMGAIADIVNFGDWKRMRMWVLAIAVAIVGSAVLSLTGQVDLAKSIYTAPRIAWVSAIVGGFLFGFGMTLASGCGSKTLIRAGAGQPQVLDRAVHGRDRRLHDAARAVRRLAHVGARHLADRPGAASARRRRTCRRILTRVRTARAASLWLPFVVAAALAIFVFKSRDFRTSPELIVGGVVIGLLVVGGWYLTGHVGYLAEDPATLEEKFFGTNSNRLESFSFVAPIAYTLELLMFWSDQSRIVTFGVAAVLGMLAGSAAYALAARSFRWEGFGSVEDVANHIVGGVLMGFGGVTALGCTIGQGITGVSTLAVGSFLALASIIAGCVVAVRYQEWRLEKMA